MGTPAQDTKSAPPEELIPAVLDSIVGATSFRGATKALGEDQRQALSRALRMDVDEWRAEFARQLRATGSQILALIQQKAGDIKPESLAYTLAVMADKAAALDGRAAINNASINVTVNNFGPAPRAALLADLDGLTMAPKSREKAPPARDHAPIDVETQPMQASG